MHAFKLSVQEDDKFPKYCVPFKVWKTMTKYLHMDLRQGNIVNIGLVKDDAAKTGNPWGRKTYSQHKMIRDNLIRFTRTEDQNNDVAYMKEVYSSISRNDAAP